MSRGATSTSSGTVTCPAGHQVILAEPFGIYLQSRATFTGECIDRPLGARCTPAKTGRITTIGPNHDQTAATWRRADDPDWQTAYRR